jgi:type IV pilus assembly protein PilA
MDVDTSNSLYIIYADTYPVPRTIYIKNTLRGEFIMKKQKKLGNKGFSLVELIVVIAIMAVLVGVLAPTLIKNVEKSREAKDIQNMDALRSSVVSMLGDEKYYNAMVPASGTKEFTVSSSVALSGSVNSGTGIASLDDCSAELKTIIDSFKLSSKKATATGCNPTIVINSNGKVVVCVKDSTGVVASTYYGNFSTDSSEEATQAPTQAPSKN